MLFKLSNLNSNPALTLGYLNPALNNSTQVYKDSKELIIGFIIPLIKCTVRIQPLAPFVVFKLLVGMKLKDSIIAWPRGVYLPEHLRCYDLSVLLNCFNKSDWTLIARPNRMQCLKELVYHCVVMFYNHAKVIIEIQHIVSTSSSPLMKHTFWIIVWS